MKHEEATPEGNLILQDADLDRRMAESEQADRELAEELAKPQSFGEPWKLSVKGEIEAANGQWLADTASPGVRDRIIECVNVLEGVENPKAVLERLRDATERMEQVVDKLGVALNQWRLHHNAGGEDVREDLAVIENNEGKSFREAREVLREARIALQ